MSFTAPRGTVGLATGPGVLVGSAFRHLVAGLKNPVGNSGPYGVLRFSDPSSATVPRVRCGRCGAQDGIEVTIAKRGKGPVGEGTLCPICLRRAKAGHAILKVEFEALKALGFSCACANHIMCMRVDQFFAVHALYGSSS